jgi:hypothetical protein
MRKAPEEQVRSTAFCALDGGYKRIGQINLSVSLGDVRQSQTAIAV